jgi:hypothetical protein
MCQDSDNLYNIKSAVDLKPVEQSGACRKPRVALWESIVLKPTESHSRRIFVHMAFNPKSQAHFDALHDYTTCL